jgi:tRNA1Val (adenine37-N6)-methyltransferase
VKAIAGPYAAAVPNALTIGRMSRRRKEPEKVEDLTLDTIWSRSVRIMQPRRGYRFGIDAVLLAHFLEVQPHEDALEIGTGSGVIPLLADRLGKHFARLTAIELQPELALLAWRNFEAHQLPASVVITDAKDYPLSSSPFTLIFSNPPYRKVGHGRLNPSAQKAIARHEVSLALADLFDCADRLLAPTGRLSLILPHFRKKDFDTLIVSRGYSLHRRRLVHSFPKRPPTFFLATACKSPALLIEDPPLIIYDSPGRYTPAMKQLLNEG